MKRDKWHAPASPRRSGALTMSGCGKAIERLLGGIALPAISRSTWISHAKIADDANLSPTPRLHYILRRMSRWSKFDQNHAAFGRADRLAPMTCHDEDPLSVAI